jgi:hypothetical protein
MLCGLGHAQVAPHDRDILSIKGSTHVSISSAHWQCECWSKKHDRDPSPSPWSGSEG